MSLVAIAPLPQVAVMPDIRCCGVDNLTDEASALSILSFQEAMENPHKTDAHFVTYLLAGHESFPRLNKPILPRLELLGETLQATMLVLDYDNPGHEPWQPGQVDQFLAKLADLSETFPLAFKWTLLYTTRAGARLVYVYTRPIPVMQQERKLRGMIDLFHRHGLAVDPLWDWTRVYRLPRVTRDRKQTWTDTLRFEFLPQYTNRLDPDEVPELDDAKGGASEYATIEQFDEPKPSPEYAESLLWVRNESGGVRATEFYRTAKGKLKGRECAPCIFDRAPIAEKGSRDATIHAYVGQCCALLHDLPGCRPEHVYALLLPAVEQLENDPKTAPWDDILWSSVGRLWVKEDAKSRLRESKLVFKQQTVADLSTRILRGMQVWCQHPDLLSKEPDVALRFVERHLIASCAQSFYLINPDGRYDGAAISAQQLVAAIRSKGLEGVIQTKKKTETGADIDRSAAEVIAQYATIVQEVVGVPCLPGAYIENIDADKACLKVCAYDRSRTLKAEFNADVDAWLQHFFPDYELGCRWIGYALDFEGGPICAISIKGDAGAGKKLFAQGLSECLENPRLATAEDLIGKFQYGLLDSPFLLVDEGWPTGNAHRHPADQFRSLVAGNPMRVERKFQAPVQAVNPVRVIFTANNTEVIRMLSGKRDLSPEDRQALAIRLLHFNIGGKASEYLRSKGGEAHTAREGNRWIRGDGGQPSNYVVARHFLWLYEQRRTFGEPEGRFLVQGNADQEILYELRTQSGNSPLVIECVLRMLEKPTQWAGVAVEEGHLYALPAEILNYWRANNSGKERLTAGQIATVFRGLSTKQSDDAFMLKTRENMGIRNWVELDMSLLLGVARREGWPCETLEKIVKEKGPK